MVARRVGRMVLGLLAIGAVGAAGSTPGSAQQAQDAVATDTDYADPAQWVCLPGRVDACSRDPRVVELRANGSAVPVRWPDASDTDTDCFYVYPTTNQSPLPSNPDPHGDISAIELATTTQAASFRRTCRVYAPLYRQATIGAYALPEYVRQKFIEVAAQDVLAAFDHYLANENDGRRIVLIGHSQGGEMLIKLIQRRFDASPELRGRLSIGILAGIPLHVPIGAKVGGEFAATPVCTRSLERGCVISFASYGDGSNPKDDSRIPTPAGQERICVNPATLDDDDLEPSVKRTARVTLDGTLLAPSGSKLGAGPSDRFTLLRKAYSGACAQSEATRFYSIREETGEDDARHGAVKMRPSGIDRLTGLVVGDIGLHVYDMQFPMQEMVALVERRSKGR